VVSFWHPEARVRIAAMHSIPTNRAGNITETFISKLFLIKVN